MEPLYIIIGFQTALPQVQSALARSISNNENGRTGGRGRAGAADGGGSDGGGGRAGERFLLQVTAVAAARPLSSCRPATAAASAAAAAAASVCLLLRQRRPLPACSALRPRSGRQGPYSESGFRGFNAFSLYDVVGGESDARF